MLKFSFHENGKFQSFEISWQFVVGVITSIGVLITGIGKLILKVYLILAIAFQGLFGDPDSFYKDCLLHK